MPTMDMPLEQLKQYRGSTPCPEDFWEFWEKKVQEVWELPLEYELFPAEIPHAKETAFYDLWIRGVRGARIHAKYVKPLTEQKVPVILQFHGYPGSSRGWFEQTAFAGMGRAVIAMDCPGQGGSSEDKGGRPGATAADHIIMGLAGEPEQLYYAEVFMNTCLMVRLALTLEGLDSDRIYVNGASQGAALALVCTALNQPYIKRVAALYPFLSDYRRVWEMDRDIIVYNGLAYHTRWFDPMGEKLEETFTRLGYIDVQNFTERITCPVLCGTGLMDDVCPPSTQFAVFSGIKGPKKHLIFPEYAHEEIPAFDDKLISFFGVEEDELCLEQI
ncbi:MAG: alpha/beta fold hydrolase [Lachnospiraceae bacterium]|nr:alpha/beta fold hydrolase [Lachnospiraceae bacterium]